jgi:hypothetical protein
MPMKQKFVLYVFINGKKVLLLALSVIAICDNDLQPSTIKVGGIQAASLDIC